MTDEEYQKQLDEQEQWVADAAQKIIAAAEHERDLKRESSRRFDVRCMDCGKKVRVSQWQRMVSRCQRCTSGLATENHPYPSRFSGHSSYKP